ncbi:MAG: Ada metal-binding domain-containing protein [Syntrophobacteraceae bacterium]
MKTVRRFLIPFVLVAFIFIAFCAAADLEIYHGNVRSHVFHRSSCRYFDCPNCTQVFKSRDEAIASGYRPCKVCNP